MAHHCHLDEICRTLHSLSTAGMQVGIEKSKNREQAWFSELPHNSRGRKLASMLCHRIVLDTVGRDLSTFLWCKVLLSCVADAVEGAQQAFQAGILHRDISAGNITIAEDKKTKEWKGVLIDWDMSLLRRKHGGDVYTGRPGTLAFTSAEILSSPHSVAHTLWDDMESGFWVLLYQALLYLNHTHQPHAFFLLLEQLFDAKICSATGGRPKMTVMALCFMQRRALQLPQFGVTGLNDVLQQLGAIFDMRYGKTRPKESDLKRIPDLLRQAAMTMKPLSMTPTGLLSLTNDSKPPADRKEWQRVKVDDVENDLDPMPWCSDPYASDKARMRETQINRARRLRHFDGYSISKRSYTSDSEDEEKGPLLKKQRKGPI